MRSDQLEFSGLGNYLHKPGFDFFYTRDMQASYGIYQAAKKGNSKFLIGDNKTLFDMTYVENCAYAHVLAADKLDEDNGTAGQVYLSFFLL